MKLSKALNFVCFILSFCLVNSQHQQRHQARKIQQQAKTRRIYAMCPPTFTKIGNECYYLSSSPASWLDAHFECKDKNAKLAELYKYSDRLLRKYLINRGRTRGNIWIGGMFDWSKNRWSWGYNGRDMAYQSFSQMKPGEDLKYHCSVLNPDLRYRWSAKLCFEKNYYLCQHRMPYVSEKNRQRIYARWNETFPGQQANEIQVYVKPNGGAGNQRELNRAANVISKRPTSTQPRTSSRSRDQSERNQIPVDYKRRLNNEINPPEVLSTQDTRLRRKKQHNKSRERDAGKLFNNIDLGMSRKSLKSRRTSTTTTTSTTEHPNEISRNFHPQPSSNHHRHNHYNTDNGRSENLVMMTSTTTQNPVTYQLPYSSAAIVTSHASSSQQPPQYPSTPSPISTKQIEKKKRLENIRDKLSKLSQEERIEFMKLKAQRKAQRSQSINDTIP